MIKNHLSFEFINSILKYDPVSGILFWRVRRGKMNSGSIAGCIDDQGYVKIRIDGSGYNAHRLAWLLMTGEWPKEHIDHIDGDKSNNKWGNLRECTNQLNQVNRSLPINNTSGYKGVTWHKKTNKWRAQIYYNQKQKTIGHYCTKEEAALAYNKEAYKLFGNFALLNEVVKDDTQEIKL